MWFGMLLTVLTLFRQFQNPLWRTWHWISKLWFSIQVYKQIFFTASLNMGWEDFWFWSLRLLPLTKPPAPWQNQNKTYTIDPINANAIDENIIEGSLILTFRPADPWPCPFILTLDSNPWLRLWCRFLKLQDWQDWPSRFAGDNSSST